MIVGYNHNFRYKGELYHVQTEDSGVRNPHIVTLLYTGGTIILSKRSSYAHLLQSDHLEKRVEDIMKAQHREMLRRLRDGELDEAIRRAAGGRAAAAAPSETPPADRPSMEPPKPAPGHVPAAAPAPAPAAAAPPSPPAAAKERVVDVSLDDLILSYLVGDDKR